MAGRLCPNPDFQQIAYNLLLYFVLQNEMEQQMVGRRYQNPNFRQIAHQSLFYFVLENEMEQQMVGRDGTKIIIFDQLPTIRCSISFCKTK